MEIFKAKPHPPEYLIHKYWARKPHNVVSEFINRYAQPNRTVLDPFCGSGVTNIEAAKLGFDTIGIDINPIATLIGKVSLSRIDPSTVNEYFQDFSKKICQILGNYYSLNGIPIRYFVHEVLIRCFNCEHVFLFSDSKRTGRRFICGQCGEQINANVSTIESTKITSIVLRDRTVIEDEDILHEQSRLAYTDISDEVGTDISKYEMRMTGNSRILAYPNTTTRSYFTLRAFCSLSYLADQIHRIDSPTLRDVFLLSLTSSVVQCSRLIPYRNNLTSGGPAWSVPGFWIPRVHLECNPLIHLEARLKKVQKALISLSSKLHKVSKSLFITEGIGSAVKRCAKKPIGYVFADPPYADSVPYLEFSTIWNSWLKKEPDLSSEIIVSDSQTRNKDVSTYRLDILNAVKAISKILQDGTYFTFTFNQLSLEAWETLLYCADVSGLVFHDVALVLPAVIPSKARFSVKGSYIGDFYITFVKTQKVVKTQISEEDYLNTLEKIYEQVSSKRRAILTYPHIIKIAIGIILKEKCPYTFVPLAHNFIKDNFTVYEGPYYTYRRCQDIREAISTEIDDAIQEILSKGPKDEWSIVKKILDSYEIFLAPEIPEILESLKRIAFRKNGKYQLNNV